MMPAELDVAGRVVLVTGAGRGIGKGIAQVLAEAGAPVAINALRPTYVTAVAEELAASSGSPVVPVLADVTRTEGAERAIREVLDRFGRIDVLINALGDSIRKPLVGLPGSEGAGAPMYTAAKSALSGFTRAQALEWAPYGIQVNSIAPGIFPDVVTGGPERIRRSEERARREVPLGRTGQLREVGFLALYLASSASDYMTGQTLVLDGGLSL